MPSPILKRETSARDSDEWQQTTSSRRKHSPGEAYIITCIMFSAVKFARAARPSLTGFLRYCSAQVGSKEYFDKLVADNKVVVFMKGTPDMPRCGFSNAVVQIMRMHGVNYDSHNVLADDNVRQGIKEYSDWPTIPQVFINGDFVGGCDILLQMHQSGELIEELQKVGITSALLEQEMEDDKGEKK